MLETQVKDVDLASLRLEDPRWPHSQARALVLAVNWVSWLSSTWSLSLQQDSLGCRRTQAEPVRVLQAQAGAHCFPGLLVSEARRKEAGSNAPSMAPSIYCLVCAVVGQALACPFLVQGAEEVQRFWGAQYNFWLRTKTLYSQQSDTH